MWAASGSPVYLSGEDPRFCKRGIGQYPARLSGGFQSHTEIDLPDPFHQFSHGHTSITAFKSLLSLNTEDQFQVFQSHLKRMSRRKKKKDTGGAQGGDLGQRRNIDRM